MSDAPRTDHEATRESNGQTRIIEQVSTDFARQLEREMREAVRERDEARAFAEKLGKAFLG